MKGMGKVKIDKEKRNFLRKELKEYEKVTPMTEEERIALHEWVKNGNSVHENGSWHPTKVAGRWISWMYTGRKKKSEKPFLP